jgi:hypothetical protein
VVCVFPQEVGCRSDRFGNWIRFGRASDLFVEGLDITRPDETGPIFSRGQSLFDRIGYFGLGRPHSQRRPIRTFAAFLLPFGFWGLLYFVVLPLV